MNYGVPYQGGKNSIAEWVVSHIPSADVFCDLFAGGCGITHRAMIEGRWKRYIVNDRYSLATGLFADCANGKVPEPKWVSRDDFFRLCDTDPYVAVCWSFGNNCKDYMFGKDVEPLKRAAFKAVVDLDFTESDALGLDLHFLQGTPDWRRRRLLLRRMCRRRAITGIGQLQKLQSLESLQRLQSLQRLGGLQSLQRLAVDYSEVEIPENAVIYCDPPYINTGGYKGGFNHEDFYAWCRRQKALTIISERSMPKDFICIGRRKKDVTFAQTTVTSATECLFIPPHQQGLYNDRKTSLF